MPTSSLTKPPPSGGIRFITHCPCLLDFQESDFPRNGNIWADSVLCQSGRGGRGWRRNLLKQSRPIPALGRASPLIALLNFPPNLRFHREMTFPDKDFFFFFFGLASRTSQNKERIFFLSYYYLLLIVTAYLPLPLFK